MCVSAVCWELSACQASEEQKDELKSSHTFEGRRQFVTELLWVCVNVYIVHKQRRLLLCAVFVWFGTAECAQTLGAGEWNCGGYYMWRVVSCLNC